MPQWIEVIQINPPPLYSTDYLFNTFDIKTNYLLSEKSIFDISKNISCYQIFIGKKSNSWYQEINIKIFISKMIFLYQEFQWRIQGRAKGAPAPPPPPAVPVKNFFLVKFISLWEERGGKARAIVLFAVLVLPDNLLIKYKRSINRLKSSRDEYCITIKIFGKGGIVCLTPPPPPLDPSFQDKSEIKKNTLTSSRLWMDSKCIICIRFSNKIKPEGPSPIRKEKNSPASRISEIGALKAKTTHNFGGKINRQSAKMG